MRPYSSLLLHARCSANISCPPAPCQAPGPALTAKRLHRRDSLSTCWVRWLYIRRSSLARIFWSATFRPRGNGFALLRTCHLLGTSHTPWAPTSVPLPPPLAGTKAASLHVSVPSRARCAQKRLTAPFCHFPLFCLDNCIVKNYLSYI